MSRASDLERQMLGLINEERTSRGLESVELELRLNDSSEDHSQWMLAEDQFSHTGENGSSAGDRMRNADFAFEGAWSWGENIAYQSERGDPGFEDDVVDLHNSLMNSPGHRANILNPDYEVVGLGIEVGEFDGFEAVMVTQNFASTDAALQLDTEGAAPEPEPETPAPEPEDPETGAPDPEQEPELPDPTSEEETPEPDPEPETEEPEPEPEPEPEEPVAEAPDPNNTPDPEEPEPEPETPVDEPEAETPTDEPDPEPEMPTPDPDPETETPEPEPETPDVVSEGPCRDGEDTFAQLQFFVTGFFAALFDEDFTFTWDGGDDGEPQTITFDVDEFFASLFDAPDEDDGLDDGNNDPMMAEDDVADDCSSDFRFVEEWDCLA